MGTLDDRTASRVLYTRATPGHAKLVRAVLEMDEAARSGTPLAQRMLPDLARSLPDVDASIIYDGQTIVISAYKMALLHRLDGYFSKK